MIAATRDSATARLTGNVWETENGGLADASNCRCRGNVIAWCRRGGSAAGPSRQNPACDEVQSQECGHSFRHGQGQRALQPGGRQRRTGRARGRRQAFSGAVPGQHQGPEAEGRLLRFVESLDRQKGLRGPRGELCQGGWRGEGQDQGSRYPESDIPRPQRRMQGLPRDLPNQELTRFLDANRSPPRISCRLSLENALPSIRPRNQRKREDT